MFISDNTKNRERFLKVIQIYLVLTVFLALFGAVYERFSHEVYSYFMLYAFSIPLLLGVVVFFLLMKHGRAYPNALTATLYHGGIAAMSLGSIVSGILEIYGTDHPLTRLYWILGSTLCVLGVLSYLLLGSVLGRSRQKNATHDAS